MTAVTGSRIAFNTALNLGTALLLLGLHLLFVPILLRAFGTELFGVLAVTWMILANLAWLDLGLSRATARFVARDLTEGKLDEAAQWAWTALLTLSVLGALGGALLFLGAPYLVEAIDVARERHDLVTLTIRLFSLALWIDLGGRALGGVLEAAQKFAWLNALGVMSTCLSFAVYLIGVLAGRDFLLVVYGLLAIRIFNLAVTFGLASRVLPGLTKGLNVRELMRGYRGSAIIMVKFGSWISLAALIGALLLYFDRWIIAFILGVAALPYYSVPMGVLARIHLFPQSILSTLFPAMSSLHVQENWAQINNFFVRTNRYIVVLVAPVLFVLFVWAREILALWISADFAIQVAPIMRVLTVGAGIAVLAPLAGSLLEAAGRPDVLGKIYMVELPLNIVAVVLLTTKFGFIGAAWSYTLRALVETGVLWIALYKTIPEMSPRLMLLDAHRLFPVLLLVAGAALPKSVPLSIIIIGTYGLWAWFGALDRTEREMVVHSLRRRQELPE